MMNLKQYILITAVSIILVTAMFVVLSHINESKPTPLQDPIAPEQVTLHVVGNDLEVCWKKRYGHEYAVRWSSDPQEGWRVMFCTLNDSCYTIKTDIMTKYYIEVCSRANGKSSDWVAVTAPSARYFAIVNSHYDLIIMPNFKMTYDSNN